jgi:hypothetical protein
LLSPLFNIAQPAGCVCTREYWKYAGGSEKAKWGSPPLMLSRDPLKNIYRALFRDAISYYLPGIRCEWLAFGARKSIIKIQIEPFAKPQLPAHKSFDRLSVLLL